MKNTSDGLVAFIDRKRLIWRIYRMKALYMAQLGECMGSHQVQIKDLGINARMCAAIAKLKTISPHKAPEANMAFAVIELAIKDVCSFAEGANNRSARAFLTRDEIWAAEVIGIDTAYVQLVLKGLHIL